MKSLDAIQECNFAPVLNKQVDPVTVNYSQGCWKNVIRKRFLLMTLDNFKNYEACLEPYKNYASIEDKNYFIFFHAFH